MSQHSLSLSPAPQRSKTLGLTTNNNRPLTPTHNRDRSVSPTSNRSKSVSPVRNADSMCSPAPTASQSGQEAHSQAGSQPKNVDALPKPLSGSSQSKLKISNSQSSRTVSPAFGRNAVKKPTKKGFKCPTRTVNLNKDQEASSKSVSIGGLNLADTSIFTQELSGAPTTQMSSASQSLKLSNNSLFTQELSGKDPFTRASNIEPDHKILHSQGADSATAFDKENLPLSPSNRPIQSEDPLYPLNNSIFTQELSCKNVFIPASNVECGHDQLAGFDSSVFTQELSNKVRPQKRQIKGSRKAKKISKMAEEDYGSYSEGSSDSDADVINTQEPSDLNILDIPRES
ncbi:serine/arginine repetitive matrix protein 2-like [Watersipora subatra]|uniref:serine/arginine repetitive matrix protein 2-like n=1 Tax=Watersipora subatra TaxID=2589382 RepID=UPI00355B3A37